MSHNRFIFGIRIITDTTIASVPEIGLYSVSSANTEFRWAEAVLSGIYQTWGYGFIVEDGISTVQQKADFSRGGAPVQLDGFTVEINDTDQLFLKIKELDIDLIGLTIELVEFVGTETQSDAVEVVNHFSGVISTIEWTETSMTLTADNKRELRRANIGELINPQTFPAAYIDDSGNPTLYNPQSTDIVPITFGDFSETQAELIRVQNAIVKLTNTKVFFALFPISPWGVTPVGITAFPCVAKTLVGSLYLKYTFLIGRIGDLSVEPPITATPEKPIYLYIMSGDCKGQIRNIQQWALHGDLLVDVLVDAIFDPSTTFPDGSLTTSGATQSWAQILQADTLYLNDFWKCGGFLDDQSESVTVPEIYNFDSNSSIYNLIPSYALTVLPGSDKNGLVPVNTYCDSSIENIISYIITPVKNLRLITDSNLSAWGYGSFTRYADGIYRTDDSIPSLDVISGQLSNVTDGLFAQGINWKGSAPLSEGWVHTNKFAIKFTLPKLDPTLKFSNIYLAIDGHINAVLDANYMQLELKSRRFFGDSVQEFLFTAKGLPDTVTSSIDIITHIKCFPDEYFTDTQNSNNQWFYQQNNGIQMDSDFYYSGYKLNNGTAKFKIGSISNIDDYNAISELAIIYSCTSNSMFKWDFGLNELAIIVECQSSLGEKVYSYVQGRLTNDTWNSRKSASLLMQTPVDILEHVKRLQNATETNVAGISSDIQTIGLEYWPNAPVKTSGEGSFDDSSLGPVGGTDITAWAPKDLIFARQVSSYNEAWTDTLTLSLCEAAYLTTYFDQDANECVKFLFHNETPSTTITLDDIIGEVGEILEPDAKDIFCQPIINFAWDAGAGKFAQSLQITNINQPAYNTAYAPGFQGSDGEAVWNKFHALYNKYRQIQPMPSNMSDMYWIVDYNVALWKIHKMADWSSKRRCKSIKVSWDLGRKWSVGTHFNIQLPHQTNNLVIECVIEQIKKSKKKTSGGTVDLQVVFLTEISTNLINALFQDTYTNTNPKLLDTYTNSNPENQDVYQ